MHKIIKKFCVLAIQMSDLSRSSLLIEQASNLFNHLETLKIRCCGVKDGSCRKNILQPGQIEYYGFVLGKTRKRACKFIIDSRFNVKYPDLLIMLEQLIKVHRPDFNYTSIQVNKNQKCRAHTDFYNKNNSLIIGIGNYSGGCLRINGKDHDIKNKFFEFNGRDVHETTDFTGTRYSFVYFSI